MALAAMSIMGSKAHRIALVLLIIVVAAMLFFSNPDNRNLVLDSRPSTGVSRGESLGIQRRLQTVNGKEDKTILTRERMQHDFELEGHLMGQMGKTKKFKGTVSSFLLHSFSPYVERETARKFLDPPHSQLFFANSPAVLWYKGDLVLVTRIWLDREVYEPKQDWPANHFADNFLYTQRFDRHMTPRDNGSIMGIPSPKQWWVGDGPIEPRLVKVKDRLFVSFNAAMAFKHKQFRDITVLWDYNQNRAIIPKIRGVNRIINATGKDDMPRDKHWMSFVHNDVLYFVQNLDPLRVLKCSLSGYCDFVHEETNKEGFVFDHRKSHLRGGTPFELYEWPYYIGVAHCTMYKKSTGHRFYTAHIVLLRTDPFRVVYVGSDLRIHPKIYYNTPMVRARYIDDGFIFPVGLIMENKDTMDLGVHVNDHSSILLRFRGLQAVMDKVIAEDKLLDSPHGPPVGYLHKYVHESLSNLTKIEFVDH